MNKPGEIRKKEIQEMPLFTIGVFADAQYADQEAAINRYYRLALARLSEAYNTFENENVDFVINLGDIIDKGFDSYKPVMDIIGSSGIETHHVTGNHDYSVDGKLKGKLPVLHNNGKGYSSLKKGNGFRFIFLNGNEVSTYVSGNEAQIRQNQSYLDSLRKTGRKNAIEWNGGLGSKQLSFLEKQLEQAKNKNEKVIIACHFPVFPENVHNLLNYEEVLDLINKSDNVVAWFNGHNHAGNYGKTGSAHFITFRGMVETASENGFAIIRIYNNRIEIKGYGKEPDRLITF